MWAGVKLPVNPEWGKKRQEVPGGSQLAQFDKLSNSDFKERLCHNICSRDIEETKCHHLFSTQIHMRSNIKTHTQKHMNMHMRNTCTHKVI